MSAAATQASPDSLGQAVAPHEQLNASSLSTRLLVAPAGRRFMIISTALVAVAAVARAWADWSSGVWVDVPAGVMIAMAVDLRHGLFYRPLLGLVGYGGTRYFPLYFVLHTLLLKLGLPVLLGAYLLSAGATVLVILGTFYFLRELGAEWWLAACSAVALLTSVSTHVALVSPHADGLACALNIWAMVVIARSNPSHRKIFLAAVLFTLAWSAKITTVFGLVAAVVWLMNTGFKRRAWQLCATTCCGYAMVAGVMIVGSRGRFLQVFRACASGGTNWNYIVHAPWLIVASARRNDPTIFLFFSFALIVLAMDLWTPGGAFLQNLPALFFIATIAITVTIFGSPGTNFNHFLDLQVASVILITFWLTKRATLEQKQLGVFALSLAVLVTLIPQFHQVVATTEAVHPRRFQRIVAAIGNTGKPILSENPAIPVVAGQAPYLLDPWMLQMLRKRIPDFGHTLLAGLQSQAFGAVVLCRDPRIEHWQRWYEQESFGPGFVPLLNQNYRLASIVDDQMIYLPTTDARQHGTRGGFGWSASAEASKP